MPIELDADAVAADYEALKRDGAALHHEDYQVNRDFYKGGRDALAYLTKHDRETAEAWGRRSERLVGANVIRPIVDKIASAEYGEPAKRTFGKGDEGAALAEEFDAAVSARLLHTSRSLTARQRGIDGTAILHLYWDDVAKVIRWKHEKPEDVCPVILDDWERLDAVIVDRGAATARRVLYFFDDTYPDQGKGAYQPSQGDRPAMSQGADEPERRIVEVYTPMDFGVYVVARGDRGWEKERRLDDPSKSIPYGCIPFVFFNGQRLVGDFFGYSQERGLVELNKAINHGLSSLAEVINMQAFSLLVIQGATNLPTDEKGRPTVGIGSSTFLNVDAEGRVYFADPSPKIAECIQHIDRMVELAFECGRVPLSVVQPQQSHAESAAARQLQFLPLIDVVKELQTYDALSEFQFAARALLIARRMAGGADDLAGVEEELAGFGVQYSENYYPMDEPTKLEIYQTRRDLGLEGRSDQLGQEHPDLDAEEIAELADRIDEEQNQAERQGAFGAKARVPTAG